MNIKKINNNGVNISYVKSGTGRPIIFIHGNMGSNKDFAEMHNLFSEYTVFAPDTRSHGKSDSVKRLNYNNIADDLVALIEHEQIEKPILFGFSDGGVVGLLLSIKHPDLLSKLFVAGINLNPRGINFFWRLMIRLVFIFTFSNKLRDKMRLMMKQPNITAEDLSTIKTPTIVFYGEKDIVKLSHSRTVIDNIKNSKFVIVKKENHASYVLDNNKLAKLINEHM